MPGVSGIAIRGGVRGFQRTGLVPPVVNWHGRPPKFLQVPGTKSGVDAIGEREAQEL